MARRRAKRLLPGVAGIVRVTVSMPGTGESPAMVTPGEELAESAPT